MQAKSLRRLAGWGAVAFCLATSTAWADSVFVASLERKDVKITNVRDGAIEFTVAGREVDPVPLTRVSRIVVADEPLLTAAELAFDEKKFELAAEQYQKAMKAGKKPWVRDYILPRMLLAAKQGNKFAAGVTAYVALLPKDPKFAQEHRPTPGEESPEELKSAAAALLGASNDASFPAAQKQAVLGLLLDVYRAQNDFAAAARVGQQILKSGTLDTSDPATARLVADTRLAMARLALAEKDYDKALAEVEAGRSLFSDPYQQAIALYCFAQAKDAKLPEKPAVDALRDVAIDYMRVASLSRKTTEQPYIAECLYRAAQLCERAGDAKGAAVLFGEVVATYGQTPVGRQAAKDVARLQPDGDGAAK